MYPIEHEQSGSKGMFYMEADGERLAGLNYSRASENLIIIDHTMVDVTLRGSGTGQALVEFAVNWARENETKIIPLCPFANSVFQKNESLRDVLHK